MRHAHKVKHRQKHFVRRFFVGSLATIVSLGFIASALFLLWISTFSIPDLKSIEDRRVTESTKIYDRTGEILLYDIHENIKRTVVPYNDISRHLKNAAVAIEDSEFYEHIGIRPISFLRAVIANIGTRSFGQGGSTITQQVVKNSILTSEKRVSRKIKEWVLALKLEQVYSKDQILGLYLNEAPYGGSIYGAEEASQSFFGKPARDLSITEAAYLAALPNAPTYYSPYGSNRDKLEERKNLVLSRMFENGFISQKEYDAARQETVEFRPQEQRGIKAPHFVIFIREYLEKKYGAQFIEEEGLKVITTLDYELQEKAEQYAKEAALENDKLLEAENVSLVGIVPATGEILTMVGSRDYFDEEIDGNFNVATGKRQPGSTFKPFVYATAFEKGFLPQTVLLDVKTEFSTECNPDGSQKTPTAVCYMPENYDQIYRGPISMRDALAQSINIPAIKTLYLAGLRDSLSTARDMGITTLTDIDRYGLTLVLGGGEVSLLEITSAYGVFANNGSRTAHTGVLRIEDGDGNVIEQLQPNPTQVISQDVAVKINDVLSDNKARAPAFGENSPLYFPGRDVAVKTGTTNDYRDAWIIGYTPDFVLGAWAGNNDNRPMEKKVARFIIAPLWNKVMSEALRGLPDKKFERVAPVDDRSVNPVVRGLWEGGESYVVDAVSGKLATDRTPEETKKERVVRNIHTILYWVSRSNPHGPRPEQPERDSQFTSWEYAVQTWAASRGLTNETNAVIPTTFDDVHTPQNAPRVTITSPMPQMTYPDNAKIPVSVSASGPYVPNRMDVFVNGSFVATTRTIPLTMTVDLTELPLVRQENELKVVVYDTVFNKTETVGTIRTTATQ